MTPAVSADFTWSYPTLNTCSSLPMADATLFSFPGFGFQSGLPLSSLRVFAKRPDEDNVHYSADESASRRQRIIEGVAVDPFVQRLGVLEGDFL